MIVLSNTITTPYILYHEHGEGPLIVRVIIFIDEINTITTKCLYDAYIGVQ